MIDIELRSDRFLSLAMVDLSLATSGYAIILHYYSLWWMSNPLIGRITHLLSIITRYDWLRYYIIHIDLGV